MSKITPEKLNELRAANARGIRHLEVGTEESAPGECEDFVYRKIDRAEFVRYRSLQRKSLMGQGAADAATLLARSLLLFPTVEEFDALRERAPAIVEEMGDMLVADADAGLTVREGKL